MINLKEDEKILSIKRRHIVALFINVLPLLIIFIGLIVGMFVLMFSSIGPMPEQFDFLADYNIRFLGLFFISLMILVFWQVLFTQVSQYYLDCWIITDERTIHTELITFFNRYLSTVYHHKIQDLSVDVKGIIPTLFKYGNIQIQTAGKFREFIFQEIPDPYKTKSIISQAQRDFFKKMKDKGVSIRDTDEAIDQELKNLISNDN